MMCERRSELRSIASRKARARFSSSSAPPSSVSALARMMLTGVRMGESAAGLAEIGAALTGAPGARSFHVVLLGPGERLSPDELRANLSLLDEASLFLLPIDPDKNPSALLRSLFARIVP